jgi:hypothetical protein
MHMKKFRKHTNLEIKRRGSFSPLETLCEFLKSEKLQNQESEMGRTKEGAGKREIGARRVAKTQIFSFKSVLI